jgi:hypothetical protein
MCNYNPQLIKATLLSLRNAKISAFLSQKNLKDFRTVVETCRIIDSAMLPLFYIWEHICQRNLSEIHIERHLKKAYLRFLEDPFTNTMKFYLLLKIGISCSIPTGVKNNIVSIYESLISSNVLNP